MRDGNLVLKGIVNTDLENDTAPYITGGVYTKNKRGFHGGRLEVKAKLQGAQGAWPAIWLKPCDEARYIPLIRSRENRHVTRVTVQKELLIPMIIMCMP